MNGQYWSGSDFGIDFTDARLVTEFVEAIVDLDDSGEVIGIEILGLLARHPLLPERIKQLQCLAVQVTCDPFADAIYIRFSNGRSLDQVAREAVVVFGPDDALIKVVVRME